MKEHIIYSNLDINEEDWREGFEEWCEINGYNKDEKDLWTYIQDTLAIYLEDEHTNLNKSCGQIIAIADLGFWDGRRSAYQILNGGKVNAIFNVLDGNYDYFKFYCDRYDVKAELHHHDGVHYITFREIKPNTNIESLKDKLYEGEEVSQKDITRCTKSLRPYVKKIYGW